MKRSFITLLLASTLGCEEAQPGNPGEGGAAECCDAEPVCPVNAHEVDACVTPACFTESACCNEKLCEPGMCTAARCWPNEEEVDHCVLSDLCRHVDLCGLTIYCESFCSAVPSCDDGDDEASCPEGTPCYIVEQCGKTIECIDQGQPHGCPVDAPVEGEPCDGFELSCVYPNRALACAETWRCQDPPEVGAPVPIAPWVWHLVESDCARGGH